MRIAFITTTDHNVGDDFVREGLAYLLQRAIPDSHVSFTRIHKHSPITVRYGFESARHHAFTKLDRLLPVGLTRDRILEADVVVQSGAPAYWCHPGGPHCADNEWFAPLIRRRLLRRRPHAPFLNLAAGTAQRYDSDGSEFRTCIRDASYIKELHTLAAVTTVRDRLSKVVLNSLGLDAPVIPCSSLFARDRLGIAERSPEYVALNFMPIGGHYSFGQSITPDKWRSSFAMFYARLSASERCVFICHDEKEVAAARQIDAEADILFSADFREVMHFYAGAKYGILNRVHGAFMMASFGRPSLVVGTDSRARMAEDIGLEHVFVEDASPDALWSYSQRLAADAGSYTARFTDIKARALEDYSRALAPLRNGDIG
jgi:hypothetical protein